MKAFIPNAGPTLTFGVSGEGVTIDPETGLLTVLTETLLKGMNVTVTTADAAGVETGRYAVTIAVAETDAPAVAPVCTAPPSLGGEARIGSPVVLEAGTWTGSPVPDLAYQWLIDGEAIAGAVAATYVPVAADDRRALSCRVTAANVAGSAAAETTSVTVHHRAPVVADPLADIELVQGTAPKAVEAAAAFAGEALVFAVKGAGAAIDPASGRVTLATDVVGTRTVAVIATNSGGAAEAAFRVTVTGSGLPGAPEAVGVFGNVVFEGGASATVSAQAGFAGEGLVYSLEAAPAGTAIDAVSGLVRIPTAEPVDRAGVVVRAANAAGSATQSFLVSVRANATVFDAPARLAELGFINKAGAPAGWTAEREGYARLVTDPTDRNHGDWVHARGDGLYRCLARWSHPDTSVDWLRPFTFSARLTQAGSDLFGLRVDLFQRTGTNPQRLMEIYQYDGQGARGSHTSLASLPTAGWDWNTWYWIELELDGPSIRTRFYPESAQAPDWQLSATATHLAPGAFGPGSFGRKGSSMTVDIRRLDCLPLARMRPAPLPAPVDAEWNIDQIKVQA